MLPLMLNLYVSRLKEAGAPLHPRIDSEIANHLGYVDGALDGREFFVGTSLTGADIQMSFVGEMAKVFDRLGPYPNLERVAVADARAAGVPALGREGRGVPVREVARSSTFNRHSGMRLGAGAIHDLEWGNRFRAIDVIGGRDPRPGMTSAPKI